MSCLTLGCTPPTPGSRRSHCAGCHQTFSGLTAFDRHQTLDRTKDGYPVVCLSPTEFTNLIQRPDGVWRLPGERPDDSFPLSGDDTGGLAGVCASPEPTTAPRDAQEAAL